jgi:pyruvate/2-oxoglutarate dehydrogenase complex dihydrolipoamide dehydrogenase (E3) component
MVVSENLAGRHKVTTGRQVPYCMFTDPDIARIGLNEIAWHSVPHGQLA